jgi:hypothetical protein
VTRKGLDAQSRRWTLTAGGFHKQQDNIRCVLYSVVLGHTPLCVGAKGRLLSGSGLFVGPPKPHACRRSCDTANPDSNIPNGLLAYDIIMRRHSFDHEDGYSSASSSIGLPDKIEILYASETGNAQDTAERVGREIRRRGGRCTVQSMEYFKIVRLHFAMSIDGLSHSFRVGTSQADLPHLPLVILITSTHGRGDPPPAMLPLWKALLRQGLPPDILEGNMIISQPRTYYRISAQIKPYAQTSPLPSTDLATRRTKSSAMQARS